MTNNSASMGADSFVQYLCAELGLDEAATRLESKLVADCGLDSLGMYELLLIIEELGIEVDENALFEWELVSDVYGAYCAAGG